VCLQCWTWQILRENKPILRLKLTARHGRKEDKLMHRMSGVLRLELCQYSVKIKLPGGEFLRIWYSLIQGLFFSLYGIWSNAPTKPSPSAYLGSDDYSLHVCLFVFGATAPQRARASSLMSFLDHTRRTTAGRTPLDEWSARRRDLYLTTQHS